MFSKKPRKVATAPPPTGAEKVVASVRSAALLPLTNPFVGAAGAALLLMGSTLSLIAVAGDPHAGTPQARVTLTGIGGKSPPGWREALLQANPRGGVSTDTFTLFEDAPLAGPITGEATITLPSSAAPIGALAPAPLAGFTEPSPGGSVLPIIGPQGPMPAEA